MECLYLPKFDISDSQLYLPEEESKHIKVLRLKQDDEIMITNGTGLLVTARIDISSKIQTLAKIIHKHENYGEIQRNVTLALGILKNRERFEFAIEKATELGIKRFIPLITNRCQKASIKKERLVAKAIASIKQSKRAYLPIIEDAITLEDYLRSLDEKQQIVQGNQHGVAVTEFDFGESVSVMIGPEGGFANNEFELLQKYNAQKVNYGNRRLRAETAAIVGIAFACQ